MVMPFTNFPTPVTFRMAIVMITDFSLRNSRLMFDFRKGKD